MNDFFASPLTTEINESGTQIKTDGTTIYCEKSDSKFVYNRSIPSSPP